MKIAFLLGYPEISGGTNVIMEYASRLSDFGHDVYVVTELPFDPVRLAWHPGSLKVKCACHEDVRHELFDVSIATWWRSVYDLPYVPSKQQIYFCQSIETRFFNHWDLDMKALVDLTYRLPIPIITEAGWISKYFKEVYDRSSYLVRNGIRKDLFNESTTPVAEHPNEGIRVLVEGPMGVPFKRVEETIALCNQANVKEIWLLTSSEVDAYPGVDRVFSKIPMKDVPPIYASCDVLLKLSIVEGMFGPPLEMMHCGGTAITTDVTGFDEYMVHNENGVVVPIGDGQAVIRALRSLQSNKVLLHALKKGAQRTAASWPSWEEATTEFEATLYEITSHEPGDKSSDNEVLKAALKLAGPLYNVVHRTYGVKQSIGILQRSVERYVKKKVSPYMSRVKFDGRKSYSTERGVIPGQTEDAYAYDGYLGNTLVVGDPSKHGHVGTRRANYEVTAFVDAVYYANSKEPTNSYDTLVVFDPQKGGFEGRSSEFKRLILVESRQIDMNLIRHYQRLREHQDVFVLHTNTHDAMRLGRELRTDVGTVIFGVKMPVSTPLNWDDRNIDLLFLGCQPQQDNAYFSSVSSALNVAYVPETNSFAAISGILAQSKRVIYLPSYNRCLGGMIRSHMLSSMLHECLVLSPVLELSGAYNLQCDEHYLEYDNVSQLMDIVIQVEAFRDYADQVRRTGLSLARQYSELDLDRVMNSGIVGGNLY